MRHEFLIDTKNVSRFLTGVKRVQESGAPEACWQLCQGEPGYGKTATLEWHATQGRHVYLRAKSSWTLRSMYQELTLAVGHQPHGKNSDMFHTILGALAGTGQKVLVDEVQHAMHDIRLIETLRDISDMTLTPIIIGGHSGLSARLRRYPQIFSRLSDVTEFGPATEADVRKMCDALAESAKNEPLAFENDLVAEITRRTQGCLRDVKKAIANAERVARKAGRASIALADVPVELLTSDGQPSGTGRRK
ncbi:MAG: ATP-binding protein [Parvibaculum sp.]|uniref:AAA family ATPase n=1 Tax=Parvibaculum sp. TaxID=2024848 RepID=UPI0027164BDE|nr:ATP-binding protein [Parvibaculum sp.]MDO8837981.1 ATP-binding protein [Parvibaculum sp.]